MSQPGTKVPRADRETWGIKDVCEQIDCSRPHVYKLMAKQCLPHMWFGSLLRFRRDDVMAWITAQVQTAPKKKGAA